MGGDLFKEYFRFTRKERMGILFLSLLILTIAWLPRFFKSKSVDELTQSAAFVESIERLRKMQQDSAQEEGDVNKSYTEKPVYPHDKESIGQVFPFNPNTLDDAGWLKLGVKPKTITTIKKYLSKGGSFRKASDIHKIYGISPALASRLEPYVQIENAQQKFEPNQRLPDAKPPGEFRSRPIPTIDINTSDTSDWIALPGIGPALARRIVLFREKLGGFYSVEQIRETYGLPDSVFQKIQSRLKMGEEPVSILNINTATAETLKSHPYIGWKRANALVKYREAHGHFKSPDDLSQIDLFAPQLLLKLKPYLSVQE